MSVIRVFADDKQPRLTEGLKLRRYKNREFEAFTISWLPSDLTTIQILRVFKGTGAPFCQSERLSSFAREKLYARRNHQAGGE